MVPERGIDDEPPPGWFTRTWLLRLGGHQIHVSLPINKLLDAGVAPQDIPLPHEFILDTSKMAELYPSFAKGLTPFFTLNWGEYADFLTFKGGLNPQTGGLWLSDTAHHHFMIAVLFIIAGHMYRTRLGYRSQHEGTPGSP